ncbi:amino acid adenylation domain-containing protein [Streptomyces varsoviensis]|nr:amino acid adenylation domain-containing protein [Streptomyces varsoviensis]
MVTPYPRNSPLHRLFEEQVRETPDAPCVGDRTGDASVTYRQLDRLANAVAWRLHEHGVAPGDRVGVVARLSAEAIAAMLGALKAGGVYVPLDPSFPAGRLAAMCEQVGVRAVVGDPISAEGREETGDSISAGGREETGDSISAGGREETGDPSADARIRVPMPRLGDGGRDEPPAVEDPSAADAAYIMFTSGTTGRPKAVSVPHRAPARLVTGGSPLGGSQLDVGPGDTWPATTSMAFDVSCFEIFGALLNGVRLVPLAQDTLLSPDALADRIRDERATVMVLSAGLFHEIAAWRPDAFAPLRRLYVTADVVNASAVREVLRHGAPRRLINAYGPTENGIFCTMHEITELAEEETSVPIGRPAANSTAHVVRPDGTPAGVGEEGELWVGGDGLALGYHGDPERTEERFVEAPFPAARGARLYRTGDRARRRADGGLDFLGRADRQVKLNGYRVELAEVENTLSAQPETSEAVADTRTTPAGRSRLVAWAVPAPASGHRRTADEPEHGTDDAHGAGAEAEAEADADADADADDKSDAKADDEGRGAFARDLRDFAADRLPAYMVPATVRVVDELPRNANGKVDRARLPSALPAARAEVPADEAPATGTERVVAEVWADLLALPAIGRDDGFSALGGQSLPAVRAVAALQHRLAVPASAAPALIRLLLDGPTVREFARAVDEIAAGRGRSGGYVDLRAEGELDPGLNFSAAPAGDPLEPGHVLLTGATGFLGAFLLDRLLHRTGATVHCLVRAADAAEARRRLRAGLRRFGVAADATWRRVVAVPGDLAEPGFGLGAAGFDALAREVDAVVHNAARVNFAYPYDALRPANVGGTRTVLRLAAAYRLKPVHYVSTMDTLAGDGLAGRAHMPEDELPRHPDRLGVGYAQTKWVAESLLREASARGLPTAVYRPYEISGAVDRGGWPTDTLMCALIKAVADTGLAPDAPLPLNLVPVDFAADALVHLLTHEPPRGRAYHVTNGRPADLGLLVDRLRARGRTVRRLPAGEWLDAMAHHAAEAPDFPLAPFLPTLMAPAGPAADDSRPLLTAALPAFGRENFERAMAASGIVCPPVDDALIDRYLDHFEAIGFLAAGRPAAP